METVEGKQGLMYTAKRNRCNEAINKEVWMQDIASTKYGDQRGDGIIKAGLGKKARKEEKQRRPSP